MAKDLIATRIRRYKGAYILILNVWDTFLTIIFLRGKFYHIKHDAEIKGREYTNKEYLDILDVIKKDAYKIIDIIKVESSIRFKVKIFTQYVKTFFGTSKRISDRGKEADEKNPEQIHL